MAWWRWMFVCCMASATAGWGGEADPLQRLLEGNRSFVSNEVNQRRHFFKELLEGQQPFACILTCSDSRIDTERLFTQQPGSLFIIRVAGNVAGPLEVESVHYAVEELGVPLLIVMGHAGCGAVKAVRQGKGYLIPSTAKHIEHNIVSLPTDSSLTEAIKENALAQARTLRRDAVVARHVLKRGLKVLAAYYDVGSGTVAFREAD